MRNTIRSATETLDIVAALFGVDEDHRFKVRSTWFDEDNPRVCMRMKPDFTRGARLVSASRNSDFGISGSPIGPCAQNRDLLQHRKMTDP